MKHRVLFSLFCSVLLFRAAAQQKTAEVLVRKAFEALRQNDSIAFLRLAPTPEMMRSWYANIAVQIPDTAARSELRRMLRNPEAFQFFAKTWLSTFDLVRKQGDVKHWNWSALRLDSFTTVRAFGHEPGFTQTTLYLHHDSNAYELHYDLALLPDGQWYGGGLGFVTRNGKLEPADLAALDSLGIKIEIKEIEFESEEEFPPPPPPPPPSKKGDKKKSPARKKDE